MFKEFIEALRQRPLMKQMLSEMEEMLADARGMYELVADVLVGKEKMEKATHDRIYEKDRRVNHVQRKIRKQLVEHLIVSPGADVPTCLILMSIIKDAERVGDLCKNLLEVAETVGGELTAEGHGGSLRALIDETRGLFEPTVRAFADSDKEVGRTALESARGVAKACDETIDALLKDDLPTRDAVVFALLSRYLKRISLHLSNIASSVVMPLHRLDYFDERWEELKKKNGGS